MQWALANTSQRPTPFLTVAPEILDANLTRAQRSCEDRGVVLRPHAKTHKTREIAERQLRCGAAGLTVASLSEAEAWVQAGFDDLFIAYPVVTAAGRDRLSALAERARVRVGVDSESGVRALQGLAEGGVSISVLVEVDSGLGRTGVEPSEAARLADLAGEVGLEVLGVFTFPGHSYAAGAGGSAARDEARTLAESLAEFDRRGVPCPVRSGGSTPTLYEVVDSVATELRPGVYALNDAYQVQLGSAGIGDVALAVVATVVSAPGPEGVVLDAGSKVIASDRLPFDAGHGLIPGLQGARIERIWEHHAVVDVSAVARSEVPAIGERVAIVPNHVCTAINLADRLVVADGQGDLEWQVFARGRND
ncbi:alanine racemase [Marmoricola sp. URHA0025 HA25]